MEEEINKEEKPKSLEDIQKEIEKISSLKTEETSTESSIIETNLSQSSLMALDKTEKSENTAITTFRDETLNKIQNDFLAGKVDADEGSKQLVNVLSIINATKDEKLRNSLQKEASKSLKSYMKGIKYKDEEKKIAHRQKRNEAFYKAFRTILEFDLSHLIGKKRKRIVERDPQTRKKTIRYEDIPEEPKKTYEDRSYGLCLMMTMLVLFFIPYCVANILLALGRLINAMFECFNQFGRTAFWFCTSIAGMAIIGLVTYVILLIIEAAFGVKIFA